jgi:acyl carrier protein
MEAAFNHDLIAFIEKLNDIPPGTITAQTSLIDEGYIDSFSILQLILFIEERCGVSIAIESLSLDTVSTVDMITDTYAARAEGMR